MFHVFCLLWIFFQNQLLRKILSGISSVSNILSGLIWVQTVCRGYQQMTLVGKEVINIHGEYLTGSDMKIISCRNIGD